MVTGLANIFCCRSPYTLFPIPPYGPSWKSIVWREVVIVRNIRKLVKGVTFETKARGLEFTNTL